MNLASIAFKSVRQRALASTLTGLSVALGVMLMVAVLVIYAVLGATFSQRSVGYDLIVGPKGSPLQLVLSTIYHVNPPIENLPYRYFVETIQNDPRVEVAIPIAIGDTTEKGGFPIVGTVPQYFQQDYAPGREFRIKGDTLQKPYDALIGDRVARDNGWTLGSQFKLVHGGADTGHIHDEVFTVVGILAPTGTPNDKSVFVHLNGFYQIQGHDKPFAEAIVRERQFFGEPPLSREELAAEVARLEKKYSHAHHDHGHDHFHDVPDLQKEVTSILLIMKSPIAANLLAAELKKGLQAQAVNPIFPMKQLMDDVLGGVKAMLLVLTALIIVVSGIGIFVSIYNSMAARRREIAIMRALGARRRTVFSIILTESIILCGGGGLLGLLLGHGLVFVAAPLVEAKTGLLMSPWAFEPVELWLLPALLLLAMAIGTLPGLTAYRTDVADALAN